MNSRNTETPTRPIYPFLCKKDLIVNYEDNNSIKRKIIV